MEKSLDYCVIFDTDIQIGTLSFFESVPMKDEIIQEHFNTLVQMYR